MDSRKKMKRKFFKAVRFKDYFIYDSQKELLFAVDWDDFFFLICSSKENVDNLVRTLNFRGFYCDEKTEADWELTTDEIEAGIQREKKQKEIEQANQTSNKKPRWKLW